MSTRNNSEYQKVPARERKPKTSSAREKPSENWSISFQFLDSSQEFEWPALTNPMHAKILTYLFLLNKIPWATLENETREDGKPLLQRCIVVELSVIAQSRIQELSSSDPYHVVSTSDWLYEFAYCYRLNDPQRLWGVFLEQVFYVLWWDPQHMVSGGTMAKRNTKPCGSECRHPQ